MQAGTWLPLMVSGPVGVHDSVEKLRLLPAASSVAGPRFPSVLALTSNGKLLILTLGPRQPLPDQVRGRAALLPQNNFNSTSRLDGRMLVIPD